MSKKNKDKHETQVVNGPEIGGYVLYRGGLKKTHATRVKIDGKWIMLNKLVDKDEAIRQARQQA